MATERVSPPSAEIVGNLFVSQYYQILHESPESVYKFYHDSSVLTRPDSNGEMTTTTTMKGIHKKIMSMDYLDYEAEIKTSDFQKSYKDGVFVLVTGYLRSKDNYRRKFTQSFFLAPQRNGYYVRNDIFQFVEDMKPLISHPENKEEPKTVSLNQYPERTSISESPSPQRMTPFIDSHADEKILEAANSENCVADDATAIKEVPSCSKKDVGTSTISVLGSSIAEENAPKQPYASSSKKDVGTSTISELGSSAAEETAPKQSYATILSSPPRIHNYQEARRTSGSGKIEADLLDDPVKLPLVKTVKQSGCPITSSSSPHGSPSSPCDEVEQRSIYVRNLPVNVTVAQLELEFEKFGPIKKGGVQVRSHKHLKHCFGFVEFESMISMNDAMQASPIFIGGQEVVVEIKKATKVGSGKAWVPPGRGLSKHDSFRMHGKFGGGRGHSKNEFGTVHCSRGSKGLSGHRPSEYQQVRAGHHRGQNQNVVSP